MFAGWSWRVSGDLGCFWYLGWGGEGRSFSFLLLVSSCGHLGIVLWASLTLGKGCLVALGRFLEELWIFSWSWEFSGACWSGSGTVMRVTNYSHVTVSFPSNSGWVRNILLGLGKSLIRIVMERLAFWSLLASSEWPANIVCVYLEGSKSFEV